MCVVIATCENKFLTEIHAGFIGAVHSASLSFAKAFFII